LKDQDVTYTRKVVCGVELSKGDVVLSVLDNVCEVKASKADPQVRVRRIASRILRARIRFPLVSSVSILALYRSIVICG
jgi:hypothetical protein